MFASTLRGQAKTAPANAPKIRFEDVAASAGLTVPHISTPNKESIIESTPELITRTKQMTEMIVARERHNISATQMREWLFYDEFDKWAAFANPKLHKLFEVYRTELLNAKEIKPLVKQYLERKQESWTDKLQVF